jgi:hypothetical protein
MKDINGRRRAEFTQEDHEYFARLRDDLARGPKGMCDPIEYAPPDEIEQAIAAKRELLIKKIVERKAAEGKVYGSVHGSDIRRTGSSAEPSGDGQETGL